jgi:hypothetical protein
MNDRMLREIFINARRPNSIIHPNSVGDIGLGFQGSRVNLWPDSSISQSFIGKDLDKFATASACGQPVFFGLRIEPAKDKLGLSFHKLIYE